MSSPKLEVQLTLYWQKKHCHWWVKHLERHLIPGTKPEWISFGCFFFVCMPYEDLLYIQAVTQIWSRHMLLQYFCYFQYFNKMSNKNKMHVQVMILVKGKSKGYTGGYEWTFSHPQHGEVICSFKSELDLQHGETSTWICSGPSILRPPIGPRICGLILWVVLK